MSQTIRIKKGLDIPLAGAASEKLAYDKETTFYGISPDDFPGYTWKTVVKVGDIVTIGAPLLRAKEDEELMLTSPVSGKVTEVRRGERRKIEYIVVESDGDDKQKVFETPTDAASTLSLLKESGLYAMIRQRPFDIVPLAGKPRDIFVTAFDSAPLATEMLTKGMLSHLEEGLKALKPLTDGKIYLGIRKGMAINSSYAEVYAFEGPHPAGNVGTQIAAIKPVNKGENVWAIEAVTVARIGKLVSTGKLDYSARVALTGSELEDPHIVETMIGASLSSLLNGELKKDAVHPRVISGNALTGIKEDPKTGFLRYPYRQITVIPEGDEADEFMGWASMNPKKFSVKRTFPAFLAGLKKPFGFDARIKGGHRAMILSNEYDRVFPMDIYPEYLIKAIMARDIERMEQLGIYEVAPEDFALPEFVDTSKIELQKLVRDGLDYLRKETL